MKKLAALFLVSASMQLIGMKIIEDYDPSVQGRAEQRELEADPRMRRVVAEELPALQRLQEQEAEEIPQGFGWKIKNSTGRPLSFSWYKTRTSRSPWTLFRSTPWGYKEQISAPVTLASDASRFLVLPTVPEQQGEWQGLWRQFIATYHPELLTPTLQVNGRMLTSPLLTLFNIWDFPKAYEASAAGDDLIFGRTPGTDEIKIVTEKAQGWFFENTTEYAVYLRWYTVKWNQQRRLYSDLELLENHSLLEIVPGKKEWIPFPILRPAGRELQLLIAFNESSLKIDSPIDNQNKLLPGIISRTQEELSAFSINWQIVYEDGAPTLQPLNYTIKINNTTNNTLYCAMYYVNTANGTAQKYGPAEYITQIKQQLSREVKYPPTNPAGIIQLAVASEENRELLKKTNLTTEDMKRLYFKNFAKTNLWNWWLQGDFDILYTPGEPQDIKISSVGGGALERTVKKVRDISAFEGSLIEEFETRFKAQDPSYLPDGEIKAAKGQDSIINSLDALIKERNYVQQRSEYVRRAINKLFDEELLKEGQSAPRIALSFSGGGYRAMIATIGYLEGAADENGGNILNCITYMTGLSGSTWAINPFVVSGLNPQEFAEQQRTKTGKGGKGVFSLDTLIYDLINKSASYVERRFIENRYGQFHSVIGLYGHALAHALLDGFSLNNKNRHQITLSDLRTRLDANPENYPLPISVATDQGTREEERIWYEFSPYYIGTPQEGGSWIDSKLFGSTFKNGRPVHTTPEYPLAQYMGTWGSAFAIGAADVAKESAAGAVAFWSMGAMASGLAKAYRFVVATSPPKETCSGRATVAEYPNFSYLYERVVRGLQEKTSLCLVDAGITKESKYRHNISTVPLLTRKVDMVIICDNHETPNSDLVSEHLMASSEEAATYRLPFPNLHRGLGLQARQDLIQKEVSSMFIEEDAPIVVYMKAKSNKQYDAQLAKSEDPNLRKPFDPDARVAVFTGTSNFNYTPEQFNLLSGLTESIFIQSKETIKQGILEAIKRQQEKK